MLCRSFESILGISADEVVEFRVAEGGSVPLQTYDMMYAPAGTVHSFQLRARRTASHRSLPVPTQTDVLLFRSPYLALTSDPL